MWKPSTPFPTGWRWKGAGFLSLCQEGNPPAGTVARLVTSPQFARGRRPRKSPTTNPVPSHLLLQTNTEKEAPVVSPTPAGNPPTPPSSPTVNSEEAGAEWLDCGKRWEEAPTWGSSLPKVDPGGHQQFTPLRNKVQLIICRKIIPPKTKYPPKTPPKQPTPPKVRVFQPRPGEIRKVIRI